jgi:N-acetylglutamate synthase-like GNAT family acetyltransferase
MDRDEEDIRLRPARNADGPAVQAIVFSVLEEYGLTPDPEVVDADLRSLESSYQDRGGAFEVLEAPGGRIVGCVGLLPVDAATCELRKMYLLPGVRGRGLGRRQHMSKRCNQAYRLELGDR